MIVLPVSAISAMEQGISLLAAPKTMHNFLSSDN